jgi:DNA-directed RNA polymerase specialized sigma24 family protein
MSKRVTPSTAAAMPPSAAAGPSSNAADPLANPTIVGKDPAVPDSPGVKADTTTPEPPPEGPDAPSADAEALAREHFARVASPEVQEAIKSRLRLRRVRRQDLEDLAGDVTQALFEMKNPPPTLERCIWAARDIADKQFVDEVRSDVVRTKVDVGTTDSADEHAGTADALPLAPAPVVHEEKHLAVEAALTDGTIGDRAVKMLQMHASGMTHALIAKKLGCSPATVANTLSLARADIRASWARRAAKLGLLAVLGLVVSFGAMKREQLAAMFRPVEAGPVDSAVARPAPPPDPRIAQLRERARQACAEYDSIGCEIALDEARKLDPAGEDTPEVKAMREGIKNGDPRTVPSDGKPRLK